MPQEFHRVARLSDLAPGAMLEVEALGATIVLIRRGDEVHAIGGICPHAGGRLAEGILDGMQVICPWHKAAFCARTGRRMAPPAVDNLPAFTVELRAGEIWVGPEQPPMLPTRAPPDARCFVVLGGGAAGTAAVQTLREEGFGGRIVLVDREQELPYDRTILSKFVLSGTKAGEKTPLHSEDFFRRHRIERRAATVTALRPADRLLRLADGSSLRYDAALIATGADPKPPPIPGGDLNGVHTLRSRADALRIVEACATARRVVVLGAGFIGMEAAGSLRERGLDVTVVAREAAPFEPQFGHRIGAVFRRLHEANGVTFRMNSKIARLDGDRAVEAVMLEDGTRIPADIVIAGFGVTPAIGFLDGMASEATGGLLVDAELKLTDGLYVAGDAAEFPLHGDGDPIRVEHWRVAEQQGAIAARNMLGAAMPYDGVPFFWTTHYMKRLDYAGHANGRDRIELRGTLGEDGIAPNFIAYYMRNGLVAAAAGFDRDAEMAAVLALMTHRRDWTATALHPPDASPVEVLRRFCPGA